MNTVLNMSDAEDRRTHAKYVSATRQPLTFDEYRALRSFWCARGGHFYGPNAETGAMPEIRLLPLIMRFQDAEADVLRLHGELMALKYPGGFPPSGKVK